MEAKGRPGYYPSRVIFLYCLIDCYFCHNGRKAAENRRQDASNAADAAALQKAEAMLGPAKMPHGEKPPKAGGLNGR